jgi:hypothetical protein
MENLADLVVGWVEQLIITDGDTMESSESVEGESWILGVEVHPLNQRSHVTMDHQRKKPGKNLCLITSEAPSVYGFQVLQVSTLNLKTQMTQSISFDVTALLPNIPIEDALSLSKKVLKQQITDINSVKSDVELAKMCMQNY